MSEHEYAGMERPLATKEPNDYARAEKLLLGSVLTFDAPLSMILMSSPVRFTDPTGPLRVATWRVFSFRP